MDTWYLAREDISLVTIVGVFSYEGCYIIAIINDSTVCPTACLQQRKQHISALLCFVVSLGQECRGRPHVMTLWWSRSVRCVILWVYDIHGLAPIYTHIHLVVNSGLLAEKLCLPVVGIYKKTHYQTILLLCLHETVHFSTWERENATLCIYFPYVKRPKFAGISYTWNFEIIQHLFNSNTVIESMDENI